MTHPKALVSTNTGDTICNECDEEVYKMIKKSPNNEEEWTD